MGKPQEYVTGVDALLRTLDRFGGLDSEFGALTRIVNELEQGCVVTPGERRELLDYLKRYAGKRPNAPTIKLNNTSAYNAAQALPDLQEHLRRLL